MPLENTLRVYKIDWILPLPASKFVHFEILRAPLELYSPKHELEACENLYNRHWGWCWASVLLVPVQCWCGY